MSDLPLISRQSTSPGGKPPLLFVHGAFAGAWCWELFLDYFAKAGYDSHAINLPGHGASEWLAVHHYSIDDYVQAVHEAAQSLHAPPVVIGHSMGGFVVQHYLLKSPQVVAAALLCAVPPDGLYGMMNALGSILDPRNLLDMSLFYSRPRQLEAAARMVFEQPVSEEKLEYYFGKMSLVSLRALWDMFLLVKPIVIPEKQPFPVFVLGTLEDRIIPASAIEKTAAAWGVPLHLLPGFGHAIMLERDWRVPASLLEQFCQQVTT